MTETIVKDEVYDEFSLSRPGKECENPVTTLKGCKQAASILPSVQYVSANGAGHDLPYGCILDKITLKQNIVYWNPDGIVRSTDPNIRQVCKSKVEIYDGKCTFYNFI